MRKVREVLRLAQEAGLNQRQVARSLALSPTTVGEYLRRAESAGLAWPLPSELDDTQLEARLYPLPARGKADTRPMPDWAEVHRELKRKGVTLLLLWQEYKATHPDGLQYSQFCDRYRYFAGKLDLVMRQHHRAGEKLFGQTMPGRRWMSSIAAPVRCARRRSLSPPWERATVHLRRGHLDPGPARLVRLAHAHLRVHGGRCRAAGAR